MPKPFPPSPECRAFEEKLEQLFDRDCLLTMFDASHTAICPRCSQRWHETRLVLAALQELRTESLTAIPDGFTDRVLARLPAPQLLDRKFAGFPPVVSRIIAIAAMLLLGVLLFRASPDRDPSPPTIPVELAASNIVAENGFPPLSPPLRNHPTTLATSPLTDFRVEWRSVFSDFSQPSISAQQSTSAAPAPFRSWTGSEFMTGTFSVAAGPPEAMAGIQALTSVPNSARAGLEPLAGATQRAFQRLLHDVGQVMPLKPNS